MKLPFNLFKKKIKADYFLILFIKNTKLDALIFESLDQRAKIVGKSSINLEKDLITEDPDKILEITDQLLSEAESTLPENVQTQKTILAVSQSLVENGKIKKEILIILHKICKILSLTPLGFLIYTESLINFIQGQEGAPLSAVIVEKNDKTIISLVRSGRIVESREAVPLDYLPQAVDETLKQFLNIEIFPSKIIIVSDKNLEQDFIKHTWSSDLPFIHTPQIIFLDEKTVKKSVVLAALNQLNLTAEDNLDFTANTKQLSEDHESKLENNDSDEEFRNFTTINNASDNFGFVKDEDIKQVNKNLKYTESKDPFNQDLALDTEPKIEKKDEMPNQIESIIEREEELTKETLKNNLPVEGVLAADKLRAGIHSLFKNFKAVKIPQIKLPFLTKLKGKNKHFLILAGVIILLVLIILSWVFLTFAKVTLYFSPNYVENTVNATFNTNGASDFTNNQIAAQVITVSETGSVNEKATGSKAIGSPAKGQVTIFSRLTNTTTIPAGTNFIVNDPGNSDDGLKFTLDNDTQVASFSGDPSEPSITVTNVSLTSADIGSNYNLPSGTKFDISGFSNSDISAKNDNAFSGGSKKTITVVSKADVDKAATDLINNLQNQAKADTQTKVDGNFLVPSFIAEQVGNKKLSKNIGDQANSFNMNATAQYQSIVASKTDLLSFAKNILKEKVADNLLQNNLISYSINNLKNSGSNISFSFNAKAKLVPVFDEKSLAKNISGKNILTAEKLINSINQVNNVKIDLFPQFPLLPKLIPFFPSHINFKIQEQ